MADQVRTPHVCDCPACRQSPQGDTAEEHRAINRVLASLNERARRLFAGLLAKERGHGGVVTLARITGLSRTTIRRGIAELARPAAAAERRVRCAGGGRKRAEKKRRRW